MTTTNGRALQAPQAWNIPYANALDIGANKTSHLEKMPATQHALFEHSMNPRKSWPVVALTCLSCLFNPFALAGFFATKPIITLASAKSAVSSTAQKGPGQRAPTVISIVDDGGTLIYMERSNGVASGMVEASIKKARAAAIYGFATKAMEQQISEGHFGYQNLPDILPVEGGVPVLINGQVAGAVGVAGGLSADDGALAEKAAAAIATGITER